MWIVTICGSDTWSCTWKGDLNSVTLQDPLRPKNSGWDSIPLMHVPRCEVDSLTTNLLESAHIAHAQTLGAGLADLSSQASYLTNCAAPPSGSSPPSQTPRRPRSVRRAKVLHPVGPRTWSGSSAWSSRAPWPCNYSTESMTRYRSVVGGCSWL